MEERVKRKKKVAEMKRWKKVAVRKRKLKGRKKQLR